MSMTLLKCRYCSVEFENKAKLSGHVTWCILNPKRKKNLETLSNSRSKIKNNLFDEITKSCKWCGKELTLVRSAFINHVRWCDLNPNLEKYKETLKQSSSLNKESIEKMRSSLKEAHKRGAYKDAHEKLRGKPGHKHSEEEKENLSKKRKEWLTKNPDRHPWKRNEKFVSIPCEKLKNDLKNEGVLFEEEFTPLPDRYFSLDIAFPEKKLGIEVNGEQHYNRDGTLRKYYQERHDLIESAGWKLLELHYKDCYNEDVVDKIKKLL